jgi:hypothetical protein
MTTQMEVSNPNRFSRELGFAMAILSSFFGLLYLTGLARNLIANGTFHSSSEPLQFFSAIIALLWDQTLLILFICLRRHVPEIRRIFAELGLVFMALVSVTSSISWFSRLLIVPQIARAGDTALLTLVDPYNPASLTYAMEFLGWCLFYGLSVLFAAFAFTGTRLDGSIRWLLIVGGILSLLHFVGLVISQPVLSILGYVAWGTLLPAASILLAIRFRQE